MRSKSRDINVFNIAMLDVLCGALSAFMFLMLAFMPYYNVVMQYGGIEELKKLDLADVKKLKEEIERLKAEVTDLKDQKLRLEEENEALRKRIAELEEEIRKLREQLELMSKGDIPKEEYLKLQREIEELKEQIKLLNQRIKELAREKAVLQAKVQELEAEILEREALIRKLQAEIEELKKRIAAAEQRVQQAEEQLKKAQSENSNFATDFGAAISHVITDDTTIENLHKQIRVFRTAEELRGTKGNGILVLLTVIAESDDAPDFELLVRDAQQRWYDDRSVGLAESRSVKIGEVSNLPTAGKAERRSHLLAIDSLGDDGEYFLALRRLPDGANGGFKVRGSLHLRSGKGVYQMYPLSSEEIPADGSLSVIALVRVRAEVVEIQWLHPTGSPDGVRMRHSMEEYLRAHAVTPERRGALASSSPGSVDSGGFEDQVQMQERRLLGMNAMLKRFESEPQSAEKVTALKERIRLTEEDLNRLRKEASPVSQSSATSQ